MTDVETTHRLVRIEDYTELIGEEAVKRIHAKARPLQHRRIVHVNSTFYGGGVAELLSSLTLLMHSVGLQTGWRVIQGSPDFFGITKKFHNGLQGMPVHLTERKKEIYETIIYENTIRNHLNHDLVIVHDPQPLLMIREYDKRGPWIWRCHVDLTAPDPELWEYFRPIIEMYDAVIFSLKEYRQELRTPQMFFLPAINPFSIKNHLLPREEMLERLKHYEIPTDLPLVVQISRFDRWKDPEGVIKAFQKASEQIDARLVLLGNVATDDPEGEEVYRSLLEYRSDRIIIMSREDTALVNALQSLAHVVLQKSIREGFGLTVAEAMWKGTPVIGGNVGGIRYQIRDGENGFLVSSTDEAADRIVQLVRDPDLRDRMGQAARKTVRERFLMPRLLEQYLDLFNSFETIYRVRPEHTAASFV